METLKNRIERIKEEDIQYALKKKEEDQRLSDILDKSIEVYKNINIKKTDVKSIFDIYYKNIYVGLLFESTTDDEIHLIINTITNLLIGQEIVKGE